jgi:hypothetical protein
MIFRRYGTSYQSIDTNFDSKALNEIGFRRNHEESIPADGFDEAYTTVASHELVAEAEGNEQDRTEAVLLERLSAQLEALRSALGEGELLVVENEQGHGWPKTKQAISNVIVEGENRLHFHYTMAPPLKLTVRRRP